MLDIVRRVWVSWLFMIGVVGLTCASELGCKTIRHIYNREGLDTSNLPHTLQQGIHLDICPRGGTCCTPDVEKKLRTIATRTFSSALASSAVHTQNIFHDKAAKFDEFFRQLLTTSKKDFHFMFKKTYGILYERNSDVFTDFYKDLEQYYEHGSVDLEDALRSFFSQLYQRMFRVLNAEYTFDESYLRCVTATMKKLQPFGDVPKKLTLQLRRSFVATRTFAQALGEGGRILARIMKIPPRDKCAEAVTQMTKCPYCQGVAAIRPCSSYCMNVMKGCLAFHSDINDSWGKFVDSLIAVGERLVGLFNIEAVVEPIGIKISDAIMNFQHSGFEVSKKVFEECGDPRREKRDAKDVNNIIGAYNYGSVNSQYSTASHSNNYPSSSYHSNPPPPPSLLRSSLAVRRGAVDSPAVFANGGNPSGYSVGRSHLRTGGGLAGSSGNVASGPQSPAGTKLDTLVNEIIVEVKDTRQFWTELPYIMCQNPEFGSGKKTVETNCWNGHERGTYQARVVNDGLHNQEQNPEVGVDASLPDTDINNQIFNLKLLTSKLENAYNGHSVDWPHYEPKFPNDSGYEGSGSPDCYDDEDCNEEYGYEGSGSGSYHDGYGDDYDDYEGSGGGQMGYDPNHGVGGQNEGGVKWPPWEEPEEAAGTNSRAGGDIVIDENGESNEVYSSSDRRGNEHKTTSAGSGGFTSSATSPIHIISRPLYKALILYVLPLMVCALGACF